MGECPPCKIILDGGRYAAAATLFAAWIEALSGLPTLAASARYLSTIAAGVTDALSFGIRADRLTTEEIDEAHAMSELSCHRAAWLEHAVTEPRMTPEEQARTAKMIMSWAEELRLNTTRLIGGEYHGAWTVDGIKGITRG